MPQTICLSLPFLGNLLGVASAAAAVVVVAAVAATVAGVGVWSVGMSNGVVQHGEVYCRVMWHGEVWCGVAWHGQVWRAVLGREVVVRREAESHAAESPEEVLQRVGASGGRYLVMALACVWGVGSLPTYCAEDCQS